MRVRSKSVFVCQNCGYEAPKWMGKCPECGEWNGFVETVVSASRSNGKDQESKNAEPERLSQIKLAEQSRSATGIGELDRVLGGGIVPGSVVLVTGEPGIGKSTLLIQLAGQAAKKTGVLYVSGEESAQQIKLRATRLGIKGDGILMLAETEVEAIAAVIKKLNNKGFLVIIDSIQTLSTDDLTSAAGSVGQVRECAARLHRLAKTYGLPIFLVSHVTKEGVLAGPKVLEHLVDTVLYLEGEKYASARLLRATKNRFGATDEVGIFEMTDKGMIGVDNPSLLFLPDKERRAPGSVVAVTMEGTRPILVEVQALAVATNLAMPRRVAAGVDYNRFQLVTAILSKHLGLPLGNFDVFVNIAGGLKVEEPALDLPMALAIYSSVRGKAVPAGTAVFGELGLLGEVRKVNQEINRTKEAKRLGFDRLINPVNTTSLKQAASLPWLTGK